MNSTTRVADVSAQLARTFALTTAGALGLALCSQITLHLPITPVPINMGVLGVLLVAGTLGARLGMLAVLEFLLLGASGAPVFASFQSTLALFGPTGGYLLGYLPAAALFGMICERFAKGKYLTRFTATFLGAVPAIAVIYLFGWAWLAFGLQLGMGKALAMGVMPFIAIDMLKVMLAASALATFTKRDA